MNYAQCELQKGSTKEVAWIPENLAKVGNYVEIRDDNGWRVNWVSGQRVSETKANSFRNRSNDFSHSIR